MKWIATAVLFLSPAAAFASPSPATSTPLNYYRQLLGAWSSTDGAVQLSYVVRGQDVRIEGQTCQTGEVPTHCAWIDQRYRQTGTSWARDYPEYGFQPVRAVELSGRKLVIKEVHPLAADRTSITTDELLDNDTLRVTSELWVNGESEPEFRQQALLKRLTPTKYN